jgi:Fur family transcriptional regulator, ferric uptake regulator
MHLTANHYRSQFNRATIQRVATDAHADPAGWGAHARSELARTGHRAGGAREEVLVLLERQHCCLSAQEIHDRLRASAGRTPGLASVYRALEVLTSLRLVHRLDVDGTACFEPADPSGDHHHHAICERCGKRDAFADPELERLIDGVAARLGYDIGGHDVVLRGNCPDCS